MFKSHGNKKDKEKRKDKGKGKAKLEGNGGRLVKEILVRTKGHQLISAGSEMMTFAPPFTDSPERRIGMVYIGQLNKGNDFGFSGEFWQGLRAIGVERGFKVLPLFTQTDNNRWMRDSQITLDDGGILVPWTIKKFDGRGIELVGIDDFALRMMPADSYYNQAKHPDFQKTLGNTYADDSRMVTIQRLRDTGNTPVREGISYIEGGNILVVQRPDGEVGAIVGQASLEQSLVVMEMLSAFDAFTRKDIRRMRELVLARGLTQDQLDALQERLDAANRQAGRPRDRDALEYLVRLELAKELIAADLGMAPENVTFVDQPAFHLDVAMAVGPRGRILIQDHAESEALLDDILNNIPGLSEADYALLEQYRATAHDLAAGMQTLTDRIQAQLTAAGYPVSRLPGQFSTGLPRPHGEFINFFNHLAGTDGAGRMFYITNGAPGMVGQLLKGYYKAKLVELDYDRESIYFLADTGGAQESLDKGGALRCLTAVFPWLDAS